MDQNQQNQLTGKYAVLSFREAYGPVVEAGTPAATEIFDRFEDQLDQTEKDEGEATEIKTGIYLDKNNKRRLVEKEGFQIASSHIALNKSLKQVIPAKMLRYSQSSLKAMDDPEIVIYGKRLHKMTSPYNPDVENFGTTLAEHGTFLTTVDNYKQVLGNPLLEKQIAVSYGIEVDEDLDAMEDECLSLDLILENYIDSDTPMYNTWMGIRKGVHYAATHTAPTVLVLLPNSYTIAFEGVYSGKRYFRVRNTNGEVIYFGLSLEAASFTNPPRSVLEGDTSLVLSRTLGPNGDKLVFHNPTNEEVTIEYWVTD